MDRLSRVLDAVAILRPPPAPEGAPGGESIALVPLAVAVAVTALVAFAVGLLVGRVLGARKQRATAPPVLRIEAWRNGEAVVLGYGRGREEAGAAVEAHRARFRRERTGGAVVLIEPVSDALVAVRPVDEEPPREGAEAPARPRARPAAVAARSGALDPSRRAP